MFFFSWVIIQPKIYFHYIKPQVFDEKKLHSVNEPSVVSELQGSFYAFKPKVFYENGIMKLGNYPNDVIYDVNE